jgi:hypothetical protein
MERVRFSSKGAIIVRLKLYLAVLVTMGCFINPVERFAQIPSNLVARLRVDAAVTEMQRVNSTAWIPIKVESLIGVGDSVRTDTKGGSVVNYVSNAVSSTLLPGSEIKIAAFNGTAEKFTLDVQGIRGFVNHRTQRDLDAKNPFTIKLPSVTVALQQGEIRTRIEASGRSSALNLTDSLVFVSLTDGNRAALTRNTGVRVDSATKQLEVVPASSFATLDSAIDGCSGSFKLTGDIQINVRLGPDVKFARLGGVDGESTLQLYGQTLNTRWYRIKFKDGFGWINVDKMTVAEGCAGLRKYPDTTGAENGAPFGLTPTPAPPTATPKP